MSESLKAKKRLQELITQSLQIAFDRDELVAVSYFDAAVHAAQQLKTEVILPGIETTDVNLLTDLWITICQAYINRCQLILKMISSEKEISETDWKKIYFLSNEGLLHRFINTISSSHKEIAAKLFFLHGYSAYHINHLEEAKNSFRSGNMLLPIHPTFIPYIGDVSVSSQWSMWIQKTETHHSTLISPCKTSCQELEGPRPVYRKNWDAIEKEIDEDLKKDEKLAQEHGGEESLHRLLRSIYENADDETRRAMIKSYQTSDGTVLSTNWNEVSKTDYEKTQKKRTNIE